MIHNRTVQPLVVHGQPFIEALPWCGVALKWFTVFAAEVEVDAVGHVIRRGPAVLGVLQEHRGHDLGRFPWWPGHSHEPGVIWDTAVGAGLCGTGLSQEIPILESCEARRAARRNDTPHPAPERINV